VARILHISTRLILGGSQENTVLSCEGQARLGHEVHLAYGPIYGPEGSLLQRVEAFNQRCAEGRERTLAGQPVTPIGLHVVPDLVRQISPLRDARCLGQLQRLIERLACDVVHTHSSKAGILGRWAGWRQRARRGDGPTVVHTIHGPPFMPVEGPALRRIKTRLVNHLYTLSERFAARRCDAIASVAQAMTDQFLARSIGRASQYRTVWSGMEINAYLPPADYAARRAQMRAALGLRDDDLVIGTVARLAEHKGHDDLLTALSDELRQRPHWKLLWVGDGWWRARLEARIDALHLRQQVITTGLVPSQRVGEHLWAMDILVHPSAREGLPRTVPQALLAGVCPVAYDVDGTREACIDNVTGVLVPFADIPRLREAIVRLGTDPTLRTRLASTGQAMCRERFSAEAMVAALEVFYAEARKR
jgi:glycosyltransferase involved in cell wall biosynthesis